MFPQHSYSKIIQNRGQALFLRGLRLELASLKKYSTLTQHHERCLFSRLASYSQNPNKKSIENFTTEVLAYLITNDRAFRKTFVRLVIKDRRVLRGFSGATTAQPQQRFNHGVVDLVVSGPHRR